MKTNNLNKSLFIAAALMLTVSGAAFAQTSLTQEGETVTPDMTMSTPETPAAPATPTVNVPSTMPTVTSSTASDASSDPAVSAVLDRLKQDSTPLSISDMSAAQDALARLNLLNEIEQKLSQIEETRQKRQYGAFAPMGAMPVAGMPVMESAAGYPAMGNP
ncbi:MAG TPA: hypothetical protein PKW15_05625, partial [Alphaproteobacteria bacterium]|nr:hypothetical protein [Alphaproteobacteria bacterium]